MNTVLQCLLYTPLLNDYLYFRAYKDDLHHKSPKQIFLIEDLSDLLHQIKEKQEKGNAYKAIDPFELKRNVDIVLPQFSGYEQQDSQEFLSLYLDTISDELKKNKTSSVIQELFMGKTVNELTCLGCHKKSLKYEDFFTLSIPIPISEEVSFEVIYVPRCANTTIPQLRKYGIKVSKYGTLSDFYQAFEKTSGYHHTRFEFSEVYRNNIHKNLCGIDNKTNIRHLGLKSYDELYAYEILRNLKDVEEEFNELSSYTLPKSGFGVTDYVDVQDQQSEWRHGQITDVKDTSNERYFRVQIKYEKTDISIWIPSQSNQIQPFRTKTMAKKNAHIFNVVHRKYNQSNDQLERFAIPFIITVPTWLTWKEFRILIYSQAKRFIDFVRSA